MDRNKELVLTGPKGVGKSFSLLATMAIRSRDNKPTVLLSVDSLKYSELTVAYLNNIMELYWEREGEFVLEIKSNTYV